MTPEHFCVWLEGFLEGNTDMDLDLRDKLRAKLESVGTAAPKPQPKKDVPLTRSDDDSFRGGLAGSIAGGLARGGFVTGPATPLDPPAYTLTGAKIEPSMMLMNAVNSVNSAMSSATTAVSDSSMARLSAAARACE